MKLMDESITPKIRLFPLLSKGFSEILDGGGTVSMNRLLAFGIGLIWAVQAGAQTPEPRSLNYQDETEAGAALLFLELHNQGLAGGKTGVCVDLQYDDAGVPKFKAAFDTNAFVTGKCDLNSSGGFDSSGFQKLVGAIASAQKEKVQLNVDGYADGQHYSGKSLDDSIKSNEALSKCRADAIGNLLSQKNTEVSLASSKGHASPYWERKSPPPAPGLNCPTRRKVVVTFDSKTPAIGSQMSGNFFGAPASMPETLKKDIRKNFNKSVGDVRKGLGIKIRSRNFLNGGGIDRDVESIYGKLKSKGILNPKCDLPPFKQVTQAMIETIVFDSDKTATLTRKLKGAGFSPKSIAGGVSALQEGCLVPDATLLGSIAKNSKDFQSTGSKMMEGAQLKSRNGMVEVGFEVATLDAPRVPAGVHKGKSVRGFYCQACGNGLFFFPDPSRPGKFTPEYHDRLLTFDEADREKQKDFMKGLNEISEADPFGAAAYLKPRLFVIKNCKDCACDPMAKVRGKDSSVLTFDPVAGVEGRVQIPAAEFEQSCVLRPPVHHACNVRPVKNDGKDQKNFSEQLEYQMVLHDLKVTAPNVQELVNKVDASCPNSNKNLNANQKIQDVMCSNHPTLKLPSDDEEKDCEEFDSAGK